MEEIFRQKSGHVYLVRYRRGCEEAVKEAAARWAADSRLNFTWADASEWGRLLECQEAQQ